ncbi:efflux RND transporter periplasmic adaptor subunit [Halobacillus sp. A1]|uniref:efflux RND transporter periplasmic adaptor subunit n=1 Tax=Halobacillus sp. A1 TaxID=2880262 RepID=UPI0020A68E6D|nr:efflux RND transporter periplasmic adaptor subunit [Halobacillus sp. A1]MCP3032898.1 efflux RND transporter periplasmic adaptor subunit [Halobacillus sp. A1]
MKIKMLSLLLITAATLTACNNDEEDAETQEERTTPVEVAEISEGDFTVDRKIAGRAASDEPTPVLPSAPGELVTLNVAKGDRVVEGETIGVVTPTTEGSQVELQEIAVRQAESQLDDAQTQYDQALEGVENAEEQVDTAREASSSEIDQTISAAESQFESAQQLAQETQNLFDDGIIPESLNQQAQGRADQAESQLNQASDQGGMSSSAVAEAEAQLRQAEQGLAQAESAVEQAELGLEQAQIQLEDAEEASENEAVMADEAGEIASVNASEGDNVTNQEPFATIVSLNPMTITASVTDAQLSLFEEGEELEVEIPTIEETVTATIDYVPSVPGDTNLYSVEATVDNEEENIKPGMMASFLLPETIVEDSLIVPSNAVVEQGSETYVYQLAGEEGEEVERVDIEILEAQTDRTAISGDLESDAEVVTSGQLTLTDGAKVEVMKEDE